MRSRSVCSLALCVLASCGSRSALYEAPIATDAARLDATRPPDDVRPEALDAPAGDPCARAFAAPASVSDEVLVRCGIEDRLGNCWVFPRCAGCSCELYVKMHRGCDATTGVCGPPLDGNGCADQVFFSTPPWSCSGAPTNVAACILRRIFSLGACAP